MDILSIGFSVTGFIIFFLLIKQKGKKQSRYAILLLFLWFVRFLALYLKDHVELIDFPYLTVFDQSLLFLDGVLLYWYVKSFSGDLKIGTKLSHLLPFFLALILSIGTVILADGAQLVKLYEETKDLQKIGDYHSSSGVIIYISLVLLINAYFFFLSLKSLKSYKKILTDNFSNLFQIEVNWLQKLTYIWLIFLLLPLFVFFINYIFSSPYLSFFSQLFIIGLIVTAIYFGINVIDQKYPIMIKQIDNFKTAKLDKVIDPEGESIFSTLNNFMNENQVYKDETLTLSTLSEKLAISPTKLSLAINNHNKTNFHEYINSFRIESVKKELAESSEQIIIIAYQNGFNSKSTFNSVFKKMTGLTPSEYRKKVKGLK